MRDLHRVLVQAEKPREDDACLVFSRALATLYCVGQYDANPPPLPGNYSFIWCLRHKRTVPRYIKRQMTVLGDISLSRQLGAMASVLTPSSREFIVTWTFGLITVFHP